MAREEDAQNALARLNHSMIDGRSITINLANLRKSSMDRELSQAGQAGAGRAGGSETEGGTLLGAGVQESSVKLTVKY